MPAVAEAIAEQLKKRASFRRVLKQLAAMRRYMGRSGPYDPSKGRHELTTRTLFDMLFDHARGGARHGIALHPDDLLRAREEEWGGRERGDQRSRGRNVRRGDSRPCHAEYSEASLPVPAVRETLRATSGTGWTWVSLRA